MQCKDIPTGPILMFLLKHKGHWCNWFFGDEKDVHNCMPAEIPDNLLLAKMKSLIRKGYVSGCTCGCRGDFEITEKGEAKLNEMSKNDANC